MDLVEGTCYLLEEPKPVLAVRVLRREARNGSPCLCVSRMFPPGELEARFGLQSVKMVWLSEQVGKDHQSPSALASLAKRIEVFLSEAAGRRTVLLEGLEYLTLHNGFESVLMTVEHLTEVIVTGRAVLLLSISPRAFEDRQRALLERFAEVVDIAKWTGDLDADEIGRRLDRP